jgi:hypothetical protein
MTVKAIWTAALKSALELIQGDIRLVRINGVLIVRMLVNPGFEPRRLDGALIRICPQGATRPITGMLRYHAMPDERRSPAHLQLVVSFSSGNRAVMRRLPLSPIVRAVCAKTVGYRFVADTPLPAEVLPGGEVVFRLGDGQERRHPYVSVSGEGP